MFQGLSANRRSQARWMSDGDTVTARQETALLNGKKHLAMGRVGIRGL